MIRGTSVFAVFILLVVPVPAPAQLAVVTRNVNLRNGPSTSARILRLLQPPDEILFLGTVRQHGFAEVRTAGGEHGWVWANYVALADSSSVVSLVTSATGPPEVYRECPLEGSARSARQQELNREKNRLTAPSAAELDSSATLDSILAPGPDEGRWDDSRGASIVGYVIDVKPGGEETVNCGETDDQFVDTHIEVVLNPNNTPKPTRLIVEVTPRWRSFEQMQGLDWSTPTLQAQLKGRWIRFTGWLFWDYMHASAAEHTDPGGQHNWRATAWEIHPVTGITVCAGTSPQGC